MMIAFRNRRVLTRGSVLNLEDGGQEPVTTVEDASTETDNAAEDDAATEED